jgi:predicted PurR-regulated permease PerM
VGGRTASQQVVEVAARVPEYRDNIDRKLESVRSVGKLRGFVDLIDGLQQEIFNSSPQPAGTENGEKSVPAASRSPKHPIIVRTQPASPPLVTGILGPVIGPISETAIVLVLLLFMLARRESLRDRIFLLAGRGQFTTTTRALNEAGERVSRYLVFESIVNVSFDLLDRDWTSFRWNP